MMTPAGAAAASFAASPWRVVRRAALPGGSPPACWLPAASRRRCAGGRRAAGGAVTVAARERGEDPQRWTRLNKPVVRHSQSVSYGQFLGDVRSLAVKEVVLTHEGTDRALVIYKDGRVRYVQFPNDDARIADVMATYGVTASQAPPEPVPPDTPGMRKAKDAAMYWTPAALILVVYAVVQWHGAHQRRLGGANKIWLESKRLLASRRRSRAACAPGALRRGVARDAPRRARGCTHAGLGSSCLCARKATRADAGLFACGALQDRVKLRQLAEKERRDAKEKAAQEALEEEQEQRRALQDGGESSGALARTLASEDVRCPNPQRDPSHARPFSSCSQAK
jgi:hypothetical protein